MSREELLTLTGIRRGSPLNPAFNEAAAQTIQNKYREDGRYFATVQLAEGTKLTDSKVVFNITEGPVVKVGKVTFKGQRSASGARLATQVISKAPLFGARVLSTEFTPLKLEADKQKILEYYHRLGHLEARVQDEVIPSRDLSSVEVVFHVDEGPVYSVREVRLEGNKVFNGETLRSQTELPAGGAYNKETIVGDVTRLKMYYGNRGYAVGVEDQHYAVPGKPGQVDVIYRVFEPGPRQPQPDAVTRASFQNPGADPQPEATGPRDPDRIGQIIIEGNTVTKDRVILNEMPGLRPGQILQYPQLKAAEANLMRRGIFDPERPPTIEAIPTDFDSVYKDIRVRVAETRTGQFLVGAGVNSNSGVNGNIVLNERNFDILRVPTSLDDLINGRAFRGAGQELRIEAMPGTQFQHYAATWREPYFLDSPYGLTVSGYYFNRAFAEYNEDRYGGRVTIDRRLDPIWRASLATRVEGVNVKDVPYWAPPAITKDAGEAFVLGLRGGLTRDTRDSFIFPTSGSILDLGYEQVLGEYTFPIGTAEFTKFFSSSYLQRKDGSGKHVLAARSQLSVAGSNAPVFERFFAGGFRSLRGFSFRGVGPSENQLYTGGTFSLLNTLEYQIPLTAKDNLFFVTFLDHGTVESNVSIKDYRVSAGFGFRVQVPALGPVPVAFDFAFPLNRRDSDTTQVFAFYVGLFGGQ
jgi:outer membrane protein insertion porin family